MTALARHLHARNHEVVFLYSPSANGLPCVPGEKDDDMNANRPEMSKLEGLGRFSVLLRCGCERNRGDFSNRLPKMVETTGIEALIIDPIQFCVELGAMKLGIPYITVATALYLDYFGYAPLGVYDWPHETTPEALVRNREGIVKFARLLTTSVPKPMQRSRFENRLGCSLWCVFQTRIYHARFQKSSTSKISCYLRNFITRVRFMMARVGPNWIFPGID